MGQPLTCTATEMPIPADRLEALYREHFRTVYRAAYRVTGVAADAEDVLQTVFFRIARANGDLPGLRENPAGYLRTAAVHAALDVLRHRTAARQDALGEADRFVPSPGGSPDGAVQSTQIRERVRTALAQLPERAAEMFALRYFEEWTPQEIAARFATTEGTVNVTLFRARTRLREVIQSLLGGPHA